MFFDIAFLWDWNESWPFPVLWPLLSVCYDQCILLEKLYYPLPCLILYSKVKFVCYFRCFLTSYFCIPVSSNEKDIFWVLVLKGLVWTAWQKPAGCDRPRQKHGREELPHVRGQGQQPRGATPHLRSGVVAESARLHGPRKAERNYSMFKVRRGSGEEIPLVQCKRNPSKMVGVARGHQRADTLKPYAQKTSQSNHTDHSLV